MTHEFKPGDRAYLPVVVVDAEPDRNGEIKVTGGRCRDDYWNFIAPAKLVRALPAPLTELERRVVETAAACGPILEFMDRKLSSSDIQNDAYFAFHDAVSALDAARAPKDPVAELRKAWTDWNVGGEGHQTAYARLERAITALEAAR